MIWQAMITGVLFWRPSKGGYRLLFCDDSTSLPYRLETFFLSSQCDILPSITDAHNVVDFQKKKKTRIKWSYICFFLLLTVCVDCDDLRY